MEQGLICFLPLIQNVSNLKKSVKNDFDAIFPTESPGNLSCFSCKLFFSKDIFHVSSRNYELRIKFVYLSKLNIKIIRSSRPEGFCKKRGSLEFFKIHRLSQPLLLIKLQTSACNFIKKETLVQVFSCEFCEISKSTFSYRTPSVATSE